MENKEVGKNLKGQEWPSKESEHYFEECEVYLKIGKFCDYVNYFHVLLQWTFVGKEIGPKQRGSGYSGTINTDSLYTEV